MKTILKKTLGLWFLVAVAAGCDSGKSSQETRGEIGQLSEPLVPPPAAPSDLIVVTVNAGQVNLTWTDNATDEAELRVQRADDEGFGVALVESPLPADSTQFTDYTTEGQHTYFYRVVAVNANGSSPPSEVVRVFTPASSPTVEVVTPAGSPAIFQSGVLSSLEVLATGHGASIAGAEYQLVFEDAAGTYLAQDITAQPDQDPYVLPAPLASTPIHDTTAVPALPPGAVVELQIYGRVAQAGVAGNGYEWRIGGTVASPTFIVYESASTRFPRPRRPVVGDAVWITAFRTPSPGPLVAQRITFRAPEPQPVGPAAFKLAALYKGVLQSFQEAHRVPGVSYGGQSATVFNATDNLNVQFRYDYSTLPGFPAFLDAALIPGNAVEVRFWTSRPTESLPVARQVFPQIQEGKQAPTNPNPTHINYDPVPMGLPPGSFVQFMITGIVTDINTSLRTWQLGDPANPTVLYGHAQTIPLSDLFRTIPDIGDWVIVTARRTVEPGPLIADQILILFDGPAPTNAIPEVGVQAVYLYNGVVTDVGAANGGTRWTVSTTGHAQQFIMDDPHDPAVIDRGSLPSIGLGSLVTVEFIPPTQVLPEDNWAPLSQGLLNLWTAGLSLPGVPDERAGVLFVRTSDAARQNSSLAIPARLLAALPNQAPIAADDAYSVTGTQTLTVSAPGVLGNDSDPESAPLSAHLVSGPTGVSAFTLNADGSFSFTYGSSPAVSTPVTFTYQAGDGVAFSTTATVTITVNPVPNQAPLASNDTYAATGTQTLTVAAPGVLGNDSDPDLDALTAQLVTGPTGTSAFTLNPDGSFSFTYGTNPTVTTPVTFTYRASDGATTSNLATVTVNVNPAAPVNLTFAPVADARVASGTPATNFGTSTLLAADTSPLQESYLMFNVTGAATVQSARLRLYLTDGSTNGPLLYRTSTSWTETGITWNNRPAAIGAALGNLGAVATGTWVEYNVTAAVTGNGLVAFKLTAESSNGVDISSREGANPPQLVVVSSGGTCTPATCAGLGLGCGTVGDGCGGTLTCGTCTAPATCGGGGVANVCGQPSQTLTLLPAADARVASSTPTTNFGTAALLAADTSPLEESYLMFNVSGAGTVQSARLRLYLADGSTNGPLLYRTSIGWTEAGITWNNRPAAVGAALGNLGAVSTGTWVEYDVMAAVTGNGTFAFKLTAESSNGVDISSREGANPPQLVIVTQP